MLGGSGETPRTPLTSKLAGWPSDGRHPSALPRGLHVPLSQGSCGFYGTGLYRLIRKEKTKYFWAIL